MSPETATENISSSSTEKTMKRILFITKTFLLGGGTEKHVVDLANGLCKKGFTVAILVFDMENGTGSRMKDLDSDIEIIPTPGNYRGPSRRPFGLRGTYETAKTVRKWKPDILCSTAWDIKPLATVVGRLLKVKVVLVESNNPVPELSNDLPRRWRMWPKCFVFFYRKKIYGFADVVVGVSKGVARKTKELFQLGEVTAVQNGIDIEEIAEKSKTATGVPHEYFEEGLPVLVAVGRMHVQKGYPYLLEAFKIVNETAEARLIIVGDGKLKESLRLKAESLGIHNKTAMVGETEPYVYMRHADIFVLSSLYEGLPLVLLEAASLGMSIVSTDCDYGPNEVIENGESGLLVPVADPEKLASAILKLIRNKELRLNLGEKAEKRARHFSRDRMVSGYEEVLLNL